MPPAIENVVKAACTLHLGQLDKAGQPYILHPLRVMSRFRLYTEQVVAVLHDTIEDTAMTVENVQNDFRLEPLIVEALIAITRGTFETYEEFIERVGRNPIATSVKLADLDDNMDLSRLPAVTEYDLARHKKYQKAHAYLLAQPQSVIHAHYARITFGGRLKPTPYYMEEEDE